MSLDAVLRGEGGWFDAPILTRRPRLLIYDMPTNPTKPLATPNLNDFAGALRAVASVLECYGAAYDHPMADVVLMRVLGHLADYSRSIGPVSEWDVYVDMILNLWAEPLEWLREFHSGSSGMRVVAED